MPIESKNLKSSYITNNSLVEFSPQNMQVSFFVIGKKNNHFKKIDFNQITPEKLNKWKVNKEFVAVIETGDSICAYINHSHPFFNSSQSKQDIIINGKKVTVTSSSEEEYKRVDEIFEDYIHNKEENQKAAEVVSDAKKQSTRSKLLYKSGLGFEVFSTHSIEMKQCLIRMQATLDKIITSCIQKMATERREKARKERKEDIERQEKNQTILKEEITKSANKHTIVKTEINSRN